MTDPQACNLDGDDVPPGGLAAADAASGLEPPHLRLEGRARVPYMNKPFTQEHASARTMLASSPSSSSNVIFLLEQPKTNAKETKSRARAMHEALRRGIHDPQAHGTSMHDDTCVMRDAQSDRMLMACGPLNHGHMSTACGSMTSRTILPTVGRPTTSPILPTVGGATTSEGVHAVGPPGMSPIPPTVGGAVGRAGCARSSSASESNA